MVTKLQGAIIAAGRGERLRNSTHADVPKPLVELAGEAMLVRQARALIAAGADSVVVVINSETARLADAMSLAIPPQITIVVRDTANSMETMLALGEYLEPGWFIVSTVDAIIPQAELARFVNESRRKTAQSGDKDLAGALAVTRWRGERKPLFANLTDDALISHLGSEENSFITAGLYFLSTRIFEFADEARRDGLDALRRFLGKLIERGIRLGAIEIEGAIDVDEAADLEAARNTLRKMP